MTILVTGAAGFIGAYACRALAARGERVLGLDNYNSYYDPQIKRDRVAALCPDVAIAELDLTDRAGLEALFERERPTRVLHLAAKAFYPGKPPFPLLHVDTTWKFRDMITHRDTVAERYGVKLLVYTNEEGVRRGVNIGMLDDIKIGDWVLVHVGFAMSKIDEKEAAETLRTLQELGAYQEEFEQFKTSIN